MANVGNQLPSMMPPLTAAERACRSVFVGNIPYEATEEQLKDIFIQAGPVVSFRLVYDRETGKPKGYGFCEYQDIETAQSAMRNLNNYDFNGRPLRVGVAAGEQNRDEMKGMQQAMGGPLLESPYGDPVESEKAPEAISKAVASLPPEQMFELMKQMKMCIQNNPTEARNMLLQNPQLAYALLQAQIVMKIVDPQVAMAMLHRDTNQIPPTSVSASAPQSVPAPVVAPQQTGPSMSIPNSMTGGSLQIPQMSQGSRGNMVPSGPIGSTAPMGSGGPMGHSGPMGPGAPMNQGASMNQGAPMNQGVPMSQGGQMGMGGPRMGGPAGMGAGPDMMAQRGGPMMGSGPGHPQAMGGPPMRADLSQARAEIRDPRMMADPRIAAAQAGPSIGPSLGLPANLGNLGKLNLAGGLPNMSVGAQISAQDQEKAALIMQVLQLTDQQIANLPPDQRQSILFLKDQISKSAA